MGIAKVVDDDDLPEVDDVLLGPEHEPEREAEGSDSFSKDAEDIKKLDGLTPATKRRITNDLKKRHQSEDGEAKSKKVEENEITGYNAFDVVSPPYNLDYLARIYSISSPHYSAINAKVANIVGLGYNLVETSTTKRKMEEFEGNEEKTKKNRRKLQRLKEDLIKMVDGFHEEDTFGETLAKVWKDYEATGNGYIEVGRKANGRIGYIGHIPSTTIRVRRKRDGFVQIISNKAVFFRNMGDRETTNPIGSDRTPNELIHIKKYAPSSGFYGIPDIIAARNALAGDEFAARFNLDYFENKAVPRHVVILKGAKLGATAQQSLLQFFETGLKGKHHRSLYIPLPGDSTDQKVELKIEPIEAGVQDSSFNNYKKSNRNEILMAHRVPLTKISVGEGVNLAVARDADKTFKEQVCAPEQRILEKKLNKILKEFTDIFEIKLNEMTLTDAETQSKIDERRVKNGIDTRNEIRARDGKPGVKGGDEIVDINKPQERAEARAQGNRQRDSERSANSPDTSGEARQPKGEGRAAP